MTVPSVYSPMAASGSDSGSDQESSAASTTPQVSQNQFMQLLVAQLQNQDPLQPTDSTQFMSELAQFSQLQEVVGIHQDLDTLTAAATSSTTTNSPQSAKA